VSYSECHRALPTVSWRNSAIECVFSAGSQLSAHALCILTALSNAVIGGLSISIGHDLWSTISLGAAIYALSIIIRFLWSRDRHLPSFKMTVLGLVLGIAVSAGIDTARTYNHRQELADWYFNLSNADRQQVRRQVHHWMEKQSISQRQSLAETAQLMGYKFAEDYVVLNYCSPSNKELAAIWDKAGRLNGGQR
jgi:hypothetical protein